MKYTQSEVRKMFNRFVECITSFDESYNQLILDYIDCYGGYLIEEVESNGENSHPFGYIRRSAREMYLSMQMAVIAIERKLGS